MKHTVLIIEDEKIMRVTLEDALRQQGYEVSSCEDGRSGIGKFEGNPYDLVITDMRLPDTDGLEVLKEVKDINEDAAVIVITAYGTIKDAVGAMKIGAFDYITKPFSLDEFTLIVKRALDIKTLKEENIRLRKDLTQCYCYPNIIGDSNEMKKVFELIGKVARTDSPVMIFGESGTGKELVASTIHYQSSRKEKPLIKVNCAALPDNLMESELFGYEKGAFTGAMKRKPGRFELADGGTIFLDEIGELPNSTQVKLLRVLQDGAFERLGGTGTIQVDIRLISATNRKLEEDVQQNQFREDLYYRLNVIPFHIPPLRNRMDDIPLLIEHFINRSGRRIRFSDKAMEALMDYDFPGNVRELDNIVKRCIALSDNNIINAESLPSHIIKKQGAAHSPLTLSEVSSSAEKQHIMRTIRTTGGNRTRAAELLGISRKTLWEKIKIYGIT